MEGAALGYFWLISVEYLECVLYAVEILLTGAYYLAYTIRKQYAFEC